MTCSSKKKSDVIPGPEIAENRSLGLAQAVTPIFRENPDFPHSPGVGAQLSKMSAEYLSALFRVGIQHVNNSRKRGDRDFGYPTSESSSTKRRVDQADLCLCETDLRKFKKHRSECKLFWSLSVLIGCDRFQL